ncbi:hypothetical protein K402DRAFT_455637 [Aulographum hederae CBS 113979]|uniref:Uncharacterized protein n=1 Tax=Aulographum hederae CBS 113979 TaxID=1176131 RepID=A0A6G1GUY6_9PEZI|nr:hypothetical protein K402DRAFT_455637 [Aulographum hederae CBS 113979]
MIQFEPPALALRCITPPATPPRASTISPYQPFQSGSASKIPHSSKCLRNQFPDSPGPPPSRPLPIPPPSRGSQSCPGFFYQERKTSRARYGQVGKSRQRNRLVNGDEDGRAHGPHHGESDADDDEDSDLEGLDTMLRRTKMHSRSSSKRFSSRTRARTQLRNTSEYSNPSSCCGCSSDSGDEEKVLVRSGVDELSPKMKHEMPKNFWKPKELIFVMDLDDIVGQDDGATGRTQWNRCETRPCAPTFGNRNRPSASPINPTTSPSRTNQSFTFNALTNDCSRDTAPPNVLVRNWLTRSMPTRPYGS